MLNTYNLKMEGLEEASKATCDWPRNSGGHTQIFYDRDTGEVWTRDHVGENSWSEYRDPAIIRVGDTDRHVSAQKIADWIFEEVTLLEEYEKGIATPAAEVPEPELD